MRKATNTKPVKKPSTITTPYDVAAYLNSPEDMAAYLHAWLNEAPDDAAGITRALGDITRAKGMTQTPHDKLAHRLPVRSAF